MRRTSRHFGSNSSSGALEPVRRNLERPDLAAQRLGVAACDPDLVVEDIGGMLVAFLPDHVRTELSPLSAVARVPDVAPIPRRVIGPAPQDPHPVAVDDRGEPDPGVPRGVVGHLLPVYAVRRGPDVIQRAGTSGRSCRRRSPRVCRHARPRRDTARGDQGALAVSRLHSLPSAEDQTSFFRLASSPK